MRRGQSGWRILLLTRNGLSKSRVRVLNAVNFVEDKVRGQPSLVIDFGSAFCIWNMCFK